MTVLADATWPEITRGATVVVPIGSIEQHGPHLPLDTDTVIASAVAVRIADRLGVMLAPPLIFGSSGEHQSFPGTVSVGTEALRLVLIELVRSMTTWARRVILVNGHGGNVPAVRGAVSQLCEEGRDVTWVPCDWSAHVSPGVPWDAHAGRSETSLMLHLDPNRVHMDRAEPGNATPVAELLPYMVMGGVAAVSVNGVIGDPTKASAGEGAQLLSSMVAANVGRLEAVAQ